MVYKTGSHLGYLTYDGIDVNGKRISDEIVAETDRLNYSGEVVKLSMVGYSLGGLIARYAIGVLYSQDYFSTIQPTYFVTFCSPHVGVLSPASGIAARLFNQVAPHLLAHSGSHLFLRDSEHHSPLLVWMATPRSVFFKALALFQHRTLYSNVINDKRTCWFTSAIEASDPYQLMLNQDPYAYELEFVDGYAPVVVDVSVPPVFAERDEIFAQRLSVNNFVWRKFNWLKVVGNIVLWTPVWAVSFICLSIVQRIRLNRRVNLFFKESSNNLIHLYEQIKPSEANVPHRSICKEIDISAHDGADTVVELLYGAINSERYHATPQLALDPKQVFIVKQLNTISWTKYPVMIRNTTATHAAAIVRHDDPSFEEGKVVVDHFIKEVLNLKA